MINSSTGSVEILLGEDLAESYGRDFVITPLSAGEAYVAERGLPDRFRYYFDREPDEEAGLRAVYNFLYTKIDRYRKEANNIAEALSGQRIMPRQYRALAITSIMVAQEAERKGWPGKRSLTELQNLRFQQAINFSNVEFEATRRQASAIAVENGLYWVDRITKSRSDAIAIGLRDAIETSGHDLIEV